MLGLNTFTRQAPRCRLRSPPASRVVVLHQGCLVKTRDFSHQNPHHGNMELLGTLGGINVGKNLFVEFLLPIKISVSSIPSVFLWFKLWWELRLKSERGDISTSSRRDSTLRLTQQAGSLTPINVSRPMKLTRT